MNWDDFVSVVTILGIVIALKQIREGQKAVKGQLINELGREFESLLMFYSKFTAGGEWDRDSDGPDCQAEINEMTVYLAFFEKIKLLLDTKVIDMKTVDRLFAYQFFMVVNNPHVQEKVLCRLGEYFRAIYALHAQWTEYRRGLEQPIPFQDSDLSLVHHLDYNRVVQSYN